MVEIASLYPYLITLPFATLAAGFVLALFKQDHLTPWMLRLKELEFVSALALLAMVFSNGAFETNFLTINLFQSLQIDFGLRGDELSAIVFAMITLLSLAIFRYSTRYLDGDPKRFEYFRNFQLTVFSVVLLTLANNLLMFFVAWLGTSYGLHKLLLHYGERPKAALAARKKWIVSRIGDAALLAGIVLTYVCFGTLNFSELFNIANNTEAIKDAASQQLFSIVGLLFVVGAMAKSAQFPFHFWLPETMETPTPVSALMHAGIINAGGFLIIRLSPILTHATFAHALLTVVGGVTAVFGALTMMTQTDVKKQLAYSTVSQLGFMMIQCGIGAYALALFHMVAHGFYKAHAFLSTGSILEESKAPKRNLSNWGLAISIAIASVLVGGALISWDSPMVLSPSHIIYLGILALALTQVFGSRRELGRALLRSPMRSFGFLFVSFAIYLSYEILVAQRLETIMPTNFDISALWIASVVGVFALFAMGIYYAKKMQDLSAPGARRVWLYFWNGGYFSNISTRLIQ